MSRKIPSFSGPTHGRYVTLQRVSSVLSDDYVLHWHEVIVHREDVDVNEDNKETIKIAVDTNI